MPGTTGTRKTAAAPKPQAAATKAKPQSRPILAVPKLSASAITNLEYKLAELDAADEHLEHVKQDYIRAKEKRDQLWYSLRRDYRQARGLSVEEEYAE
jgi:hypothetical protein